MIDFRYHLVSLVSVFLALAVGIVLGAGPLKGSIGTELTKSVAVLRQQKQDLNDQLATARDSIDHRDAYFTAITPYMVGGQLSGRSVAIVTLPGVDGKTADPLNDAITAAGGKVTERVSLSGSWVDPAQADARAGVVADLTSQLPISWLPAGGTTDEQLPHLLAEALVDKSGETFTGSDSPAATVLKALRSAKLIDVKGDVRGFAGAALILAPGNPDSSDANAQPTPSDTPETAYLTLATQLDTIGGGTVVSGPASAAAGAGVLAAIREDDDAKAAVSTVDTGTTPMGVITAVLALREQLEGGIGAYGFVGGDTKKLPTLIATGTTSTTTSSPTATQK